MSVFQRLISPAASIGVGSAGRSRRKAVNITIDAKLLAAAKDLEINISQACERGLGAEISNARGENWLLENREALDAFNDYVDTHGIPLAKYRQF